MLDGLLLPVTFLASLGCGLIAGAFFAFSNFVMKALDRTQGMAAMQSINVFVLNPLFLGIFVGTAVACGVLAIYSLFRWQSPGSAWLLAGSALYLVGTFGVTMAFNVPLNNILAGVDASKPEAIHAWRSYVVSWTRWNHVRTIAALAALAALTIAL
ncbi:MAG TPA: anthrone oxygenase family protein [Thermoanaerobaculia bacterium]|nr:anthrone oxygenase family protein [Thermoanaerobaculia bacterium]